MKKTLALVLALAMVFSTITVAFAEDTISADAQICSDLGMLKGETGTVDAAYTATAPTRLQSAVMFLRLKGLEAEALAFTGEANFADGNIAWAEGSNLLAYLKANPQLGWQGDGTNFNPNNPITVQEYYKVLLEALGYKQTTAEVVGDFAYADVITFAAGKGLTKVAEVTNYTVNDLAIATVEALKADMKEGGKTLAATLVEAGKIDKAKAIAAQLYTDVATATDATLKAAKAIGNAAVEVEFTAAVEKAFAENIANYAIVEKGTTTALEVKAAVLDGTKKVVLTTAAQTSGKAYTLTVGAVGKNFGGVAKDTGAPALDTVKGTDTERVEIAFTKVMDIASALDVANYAIAGVTVESVAWADSSRKAVELTTKGLVANKTYKVTVTNVKSIDLVNLKSASKNFLAISDKKAPDASITKANCTNTRIIVQYLEPVEKTSAENLANYKLTVGSSTDNVLEITAAKLVADADGDDTIVELTTAPQKSGQKYVLHINGVADTSVLANVMTKEKKLDYYGTRVDTTKPTVAKVEYITDSLIQVEYTEASRLDATSTLDLNNYSVNNDVTVEKVAFTDEDDADCVKVRLTVSQLGEKGSYVITIKDIADEYGNVMGEKKFTRTFNKATVNVPATVSKVVSSGLSTVKVYFTKEVDSTTAKDVANYTINNEIGTPIKVSLSSDSKCVTLTTDKMTANKEYKVTVNGVKDLADNTITSVAAKFVVSATENDIDAPTIEDITVVNDRVIKVTFNEVIAAVVDTTTITIDIDGNLATTADRVTAKYKVSADDDNMILEFRLADIDAFATERDVILVGTDAEDIAGNVCEDNDIVFSATAEDPEKVELLSWEQTSVKEFTLTFSEKIADPAVTTINASAIAGQRVPYALTIDVDDDDPTIVYLTSSQKMDAEKVFELDLTNFDYSAPSGGSTGVDFLANYHGIEVAEDEKGQTVIETTIEDTDAPYIENVTAKSSTKIVVAYNESLSSSGTYKIEYINDDGATKTIPASGITVSAPNDNEVTLTLSGYKLEAKYVYTLMFDAARAQDIAYNKADTEATFDFAGTDVVAVDNYIAGINIINGAKFEIIPFSTVASAAATVDLVYGKADTPITGSTVTPVLNTAGRISRVTVELPKNVAGDYVHALASGTTYTAKLTIGTTVIGSYAFAGMVDSGITVEKITTNYVFSYSGMKNGDIVVMKGTGATPVTATVAGGSVSIATSSFAEAVADILVIRNGVVLYFDKGYLLP